MKSIVQFLRYLSYLFRASNEHSVHSPFVYDLYTNIIKETKHYYIFANIESVRAKLLLDNTSISVTDFGMGSSSKRKISSIAEKALKKPKAAELLFRLVNHFNPKIILELGTSLGITTSYLAAVNSDTQVHTLEGCPETAKIAKQTFETLRLNNVHLTVGAFEQTLENVISTLPSLDFVFIDGNHRKEATLKYFEACLEKSNDQTVIVVDDIHWSDGMQDAWLVIKRHQKVFISIDLFEVGIIILDPKNQKQDYILRY